MKSFLPESTLNTVHFIALWPKCISYLISFLHQTNKAFLPPIFSRMRKKPCLLGKKQQIVYWGFFHLGTLFFFFFLHVSQMENGELGNIILANFFFYMFLNHKHRK